MNALLPSELSEKQKELKRKHGTPEQFEAAVWNALGEISITEARDAIYKYEKEWVAAGKD